jgi:predicted methyltransferase
MPDLPQAVAVLRQEWGLDFARVRRVLAALADDRDVSRLVACSGLPRRDVESILAGLTPFLETEADLRSSVADVCNGGTQVSLPHEDALAAQMAELAAGLPPSRWRLDHVPATPETMAKRALYLAAEYALDGASVLCLGDHDLTSLAIGSVVSDVNRTSPTDGSVASTVDLAVVDIDEPILDHVTGSADRLGFPVTSAWADLRLALPPSLIGSADLVFTDPPYTIDGMRLFLVRALEALRPTGHERLAFCFGTGERHLVKALEVQSLLGDLRLALEAMLPGFNHYTGAEAIGARSDLYICRPTKGAKVGEPPRPGRSRRRSEARIYTRGPSAVEASGRALPESVAPAAIAAAGDGPIVLVGDGWSDASVELPEFFGRLAAWATAARPGPFPFPGTLVINTHPDHGGVAFRALLLAAPERAVLIAPRRDIVAPGVLAAAYDFTAVPTGPGGDPAVVLATRHDRPPANAADAVLRHIVLHPGAKIVNAWRDALLAIAREAGTPMTKNEARARIAAASPPPGLARLRTWELPLSALRALVGAVPPTVLH